MPSDMCMTQQNFWEQYNLLTVFQGILFFSPWMLSCYIPSSPMKMVKLLGRASLRTFCLTSLQRSASLPSSATISDFLIISSFRLMVQPWPMYDIATCQHFHGWPRAALLQLHPLTLLLFLSFIDDIFISNSSFLLLPTSLLFTPDIASSNRVAVLKQRSFERRYNAILLNTN